MTQFNTALAQLSHMQQETMQNVHQMQTQLQQWAARTASPSTATAASSQQPSHPSSLIPPNHLVPGNIKLTKPSLFTGATKSNVETWIFEVEQYLTAYGVTDDSQRIAFACASFKGVALQWWQNQCLTHPGVRLTWNQFKDEVRRRFQPIEASRTARVNLRNLKQGNKSVADYCSAFYEQLQLIHDMSEADKVENFMIGLNSIIYEEVDRRDPLTLQDAMMYAQRTEIRGRVRAVQRGSRYDMYKSYNKTFNHPRPSGSERWSNNHGTSVGSTNNHSTTGTAPMELGKIGTNEEEEDHEAMEEEWKKYLNEYEEESQQEDSGEEFDEINPGATNEEVEESDQELHAIMNKRQLPKEEFIRLKKEGKCFKCKQPGHWSKECPNSKGRFGNRRFQGRPSYNGTKPTK